ncbi:MAG: tyrosine recombinase XerC [Fimbriimonadaceae bacterium]
METQLAWVEPIEEFLDYLKSERGASVHTLSAYSGDLNLATDFFQKRGLADWRELSVRSVREYANTLGPPLAASTAQRRMSSLRSLVKYLKRNGKGPEMEVPDSGGFKKPRSLPKAVPIQSLMRILEMPDLSKPAGLRDRALLELIYGAGLRVSEAVGLDLGQIDLQEGAIRVTGKRGKTRWIPVPAVTMSWIRSYLESARPALAKVACSNLILSDRGRAMARQTVDARIARYARLAGLPSRVSPHVLRHSYAVHLIENGADLRAIQELLGHESIATTQIYTHLDMSHLRATFDKAHPRR